MRATLLAWACLATIVTAAEPPVEIVAEFPDQQVTGVAVAPDGRVFVNFPYWANPHEISVAVAGGGSTLTPYPDAAWNRKDGDPAQRWVCVQSVQMDATGALWVLDPAAPMLETVVPGGAKLVKFDLATNRPVQTILFPPEVAPERSYLNDVRVDAEAGFAYLTESGLGSLVVVDLKSGKSRRLLAGHPSTKAEDITLHVDGLTPKDPKTGKSPSFHADGIALDLNREWLYWHALTGRTLWRVRTADLRDASLDEEGLAGHIEKLAETPAPDGMLEGRDGMVYLTAIERNGIYRFDVDRRETKRVLEDDLLQWPDSLAWGPEGHLYVTASQIHRMPKYNDDKDRRDGRPFRVLRIKLP